MPLAPALGGVLPVPGGVLPDPGGIISKSVGSAVGSSAQWIFNSASEWVASGAVWLIGQVGSLMSATTSVGLGTDWFKAHEAVMMTTAAAVMLPMACAGAIQAVFHQNISVLLRSFLVNLPLALLFTGVAVELVRLGLSITDTLSDKVLSTGGVDANHLFSSVESFLSTPLAVANPAAGPVVFMAAVLVSVSALMLWLELVVRAAAVTAATFFLPLALATLVWPAISHWCRRLAETIAALVLSKFVIAAILSLGVGALAGGVAGAPDDGGVAAAVTGIALLLMSALSPFALLKLVPVVEAGAVMHLEGMRHRATSVARRPMAHASSVASDVLREALAKRLGLGSADPSSNASVLDTVGPAGGGAASAGGGSGPDVASSVSAPDRANEDDVSGVPQHPGSSPRFEDQPTQ